MAQTSHKQIFLCADSTYCKDPSLLGVRPQILTAAGVALFNTAEEARACIDQHGDKNARDELWVVSADDCSPLNTACTIKENYPSLTVRVFTDHPNTATLNRLENGFIDAVSPYRDFRAFFTQPVSVNETAGKRARLFPVLSGSGGCGKSVICAGLAALCSRLGKATLCLDADLQFGDMSYAFGQRDAVTIDQILQNESLLDSLSSGNGEPALIACPPFPEMAEAVIPQIPSLLDRLSPRYDAIFVNTGSFWTEAQAFFMERAAASLYVIDQRPTSLRNSARMLELCAHCNIATTPLLFLVNRCAKGQLYTAADISNALHGLPAVEIAEGGMRVEDYMTQGDAIRLTQERTPFCTSLAALLSRLFDDLTMTEAFGALDVPVSRHRSIFGFRSKGDDRP